MFLLHKFGEHSLSDASSRFASTLRTSAQDAEPGVFGA
jgi:hypothetical protein